LARRPAIALRLPGSGAPTRAQLTVLGRALEGGYVHQVSYRHDRWQAELAGHPRLGPLAPPPIWEIATPPRHRRSVLPRPAADGAAAAPLADAAGDPVLAPAPEAAVRLWHPSRASPADRAAWRERVLSLRLDQPFRQAFREHYVAREA